MTKKVPNWLLSGKGIAQLYYKITKKTNPKEKYGPFLSPEPLYESERASAELNYSKRDMRSSLEDTVEWVESNGRQEPLSLHRKTAVPERQDEAVRKAGNG